jgi:hypothetical protein
VLGYPNVDERKTILHVHRAPPPTHLLSEIDSDGHAVDANSLNKASCRTWSDACRYTMTARLLTLKVLATARDIIIARYPTRDGDGRTASAD